MLDQIAAARRLYEAVASRDVEGLRHALADDFVGRVSDGMPLGVGGEHKGPETMIRGVWTKVFATYDVHADVERFYASGDDHVVAVGHYRGTVRASGQPIEAAFAHVLTIRDGRIARLHQITDTERWPSPNRLRTGEAPQMRLPNSAHEIHHRRKLPTTAHTSRPWRIHEVAPEFEVEDVWALPTPGGPDDLPRLVSQAVSGDFPASGPLIVRFLWELRWKIGRLLGWEKPEAGLGARVASLRERLPADLRAAPTGPDFTDVPMTSLFMLEDEFAAEMANRTVHSILHLGWVPDGTGGYHGQMAVLVKPNGLLGAAYMAAIKPFRYLFVYPALMRWLERDWQENRPVTRAGRRAQPRAQTP
jgi:ketosteroid isomerase-like protein